MGSVEFLIKLNSRFKAPVHPFNLSNDGVMSYAEWQFQKGAETIKFFLGAGGADGVDGIFKGKDVLDVGCGAAGKAVYYASLGARKVIGLELLEKYRAEAEALAAEKGFAGNFEFLCADAADTGIGSSTIDTIIMNDAMEHVGDPEGTLGECIRVLKPGGRLYINFPPYYHPFGAHLSDAIHIPWVHIFFKDSTLISAYKALVADLPDGDERAAFRISAGEGGQERFSYINKMTIKRFKKIVAAAPAKCVHYREAPLRGFLAVPAKMPLLKEMLVKMVVCVFEK